MRRFIDSNMAQVHWTGPKDEPEEEKAEVWRLYVLKPAVGINRYHWEEIGAFDTFLEADGLAREYMDGGFEFEDISIQDRRGNECFIGGAL